MFNNFYARLFSFIFRSDRQGCVGRIREVGYEAFAEEMRLAGRMNRPVTKKIDTRSMAGGAGPHPAAGSEPDSSEPPIVI